MSVRYRLASRLLGYHPVPVPDDKGVYVVIREGNASAVLTADRFRLRSTTRIQSLDPNDLSYYERPYTFTRFVGTVKR